MSTCTEIIKDKITSVCEDSSNIQKYTNIDSFLDVILDFQHDLKNLTTKINELTDLLLNFYIEL